MSDLQLTISSDDEESSVGTKTKRHEPKRVDESDDDNDDMNDEFEFGGLMVRLNPIFDDLHVLPRIAKI